MRFWLCAFLLAALGCETAKPRPFLANEKRQLWLEVQYKEAAKKEADGDLVGAVEILRRIQATDPAKVEPYLDMARILLELKWYPQTQEVLSLAFANDVDDPRLYPYQAMLLVRLEKPAEALQVLEDAESARFLSSRYTVAITAAELLGDQEAARRWAKLGCEEAPNAALTTMYAGLLWIDGDHDEALALYDSALKLEPGRPAILEAAALCAYEAGEPERALTHFAALAVVSDLRPAVYRLKGLAHAEVGEREAALRELYRAVDAGLTEAWGELGQLYLEAGDFTKARKAFGNHLRSHPRDEVSQYGLARALMALDRPAEAVANLENAGETYLLLCALGDARLLSGDREGAQRAWGKALDLRPEAQYPRAALDRLARP